VAGHSSVSAHISAGLAVIPSILTGRSKRARLIFMRVPQQLSPDLQHFVREQIANGTFRSEDEVVLAALRLLVADIGGADQSYPSPFQAGETHSRISQADLLASDLANAPKRSPRGLLSDLHNDIGIAEFRTARNEVWMNLTEREA
jgi:Arc/MetJ-type ribon-helix-helix transcriptional regulator